jgi:transcriptional regulator
MYRPPHFDEHDPVRLSELMRGHPFATVVTQDGATPFASHIPVLYHAGEGALGTLVTHMAQANPQWRHFAGGREVLVIFHGPHAYISPSWYETPVGVPTWNYAVVHAYGIPRVIADPADLRVMLRELLAAFESHRPVPYGAELTDAYLDKLSPGIVGFAIPIARLEGKLKLSQNRSTADKAGVIAALDQSSDQTERELAEMMSQWSSLH